MVGTTRRPWRIAVSDLQARVRALVGCHHRNEGQEPRVADRGAQVPSSGVPNVIELRSHQTWAPLASRRARSSRAKPSSGSLTVPRYPIATVAPLWAMIEFLAVSEACAKG